MKEYNIKIIALDLDGTAFDPNSKVSPGNRQAFRRASQKGIEIVIATGRAYQSLPEDLFNIEELRYVITSNGARIYDIKENKAIYESNLQPEAIDALRQIRKDQKAFVEACIDGQAYMDQEEWDNVLGPNTKNRSIEYVTSTRLPVPDIDQYMAENSNKAENICFYYDGPDEKAAFFEILSKVPGIAITSSFPNCHEIGSSSTSKANALAYLLEKFQLTQENLMAMGDSHNDLEMLKFAHLGVAMGNATQEVKDQISTVTLSNAEDGVAAAIYKYAL